MAGAIRPPSESKMPGLPGYHRYNMQPWLVSVTIVASTLALIFVILRLLCRRITSQLLWWDDWMMIFSGIWALVALVFLFLMHSCGLGLHVDVVDPGDSVAMMKWLIAAEILYAWSLVWTKLSVLMLYYRVFRIKSFKVAASVVGTLVVAWGVCITFLFVFTCTPIQKLWNSNVPGKCINQMGTWIANAASTILTDLLILFLPAPNIWKLQLKRPMKIGVCLSFGLGLFVVFTSSYRVHVLLTYNANDRTYTLTPTVGWTAIEISSGIISANLPTLLPAVAGIRRCLGLAPVVSNPSNEQHPYGLGTERHRRRTISSERLCAIRSIHSGKSSVKRPDYEIYEMSNRMERVEGTTWQVSGASNDSMDAIDASETEARMQDLRR